MTTVLDWLPVAIAAAVILIYLLRLPARPVEVGSLHLWRRLLVEKSPVRNWLRFLLSLLLATAIAVLLALTLVRGGLLEDSASGKRLMVLVDNSPSMATLQSGRTRLAIAQDAARREVRRAPTGSRFLISSTHPSENDDQPRNDSGDWLDASEASSVINNISVGHGAPRTLRVPAAPGSPEVLHVTDGVAPRPRLLAGDSLGWRTITVAEPVRNAGISTFAVRSVESALEGGLAATRREADLEVVHSSDRPGSVRLTVRDSERVVFERNLELEPVAIWSASLDATRWAPGDVVARVELAGDAFERDDGASLTVDAPRRVAMIGRPTPFVRRLIDGHPHLRVTRGKRLSEIAGVDRLGGTIQIGVAPADPPSLPTLLIDPPPRAWLPLPEQQLSLRPGAQRLDAPTRARSTPDLARLAEGITGRTLRLPWLRRLDFDNPEIEVATAAGKAAARFEIAATIAGHPALLVHPQGPTVVLPFRPTDAAAGTGGALMIENALAYLFERPAVELGIRNRTISLLRPRPELVAEKVVPSLTEAEPTEPAPIPWRVLLSTAIALLVLETVTWNRNVTY